MYQPTGPDPGRVSRNSTLCKEPVVESRRDSFRKSWAPHIWRGPLRQMWDSTNLDEPLPVKLTPRSQNRDLGHPPLHQTGAISRRLDRYGPHSLRPHERFRNFTGTLDYDPIFRLQTSIRGEPAVGRSIKQLSPIHHLAARLGYGRNPGDKGTLSDFGVVTLRDKLLKKSESNILIVDR